MERKENGNGNDNRNSNGIEWKRFKIIRKMNASQSEEKMEVWMNLIRPVGLGFSTGGRCTSSSKLIISEASSMEDHGNNQVTRFLTKVILEMSKIKGELRSLNNGLNSLRDDHKRSENHIQESLQYIMDGLKRVEGFSEYAGVDCSCKKYDGSVDNLHKKRNSCFANGISIENKRARSDFATNFCAKGEMSSGLKSNLKGEAERGVKVTPTLVTRVGISSNMKKSSNRFDKPGVFDKSGSCPNVFYKCGSYHLSKPLVVVDQATVLEYIFDEKLDPL
ncbi:hypothetical protein TIFTF001_040361 [Ficus carica]|uniref:Uncharacterized protein n=1 Tax=Ficus carica TaxID=3494 RepID=A0AA87Z7B0_FICCA|nr:hypothetical protein TIFTF001_040359 [Ficus carica]GMN22891.1 hypothetical protein TIFTF001_040361 [Ficus carica]